MTSLIERIEAATGPCRELDAEGINAFVAVGGMQVRFSPPAYTSSLDAAMTLVPDDAMWRLGHDGKGVDPSEFLCEIVSGPECRCYCAIAPTAALALCAAALRARGVE